jgi:hypothetical protein
MSVILKFVKHYALQDSQINSTLLNLDEVIFYEVWLSVNIAELQDLNLWSYS